jgi:hypothetical protein
MTGKLLPFMLTYSNHDERAYFSTSLQYPGFKFWAEMLNGFYRTLEYLDVCLDRILSALVPSIRWEKQESAYHDYNIDLWHT